jgi:hypothetical protein
MQSAITRLALLQFLAVIYSILASAIFLKICGYVESGQAFAAWLRNYGFILLAVPAVWFLLASREAHRPKRDTGDFNAIFWSGLALLSALVIVGIVGTGSATRPMTHIVLVVAQPTPTPVPDHLRPVLE